MSDFETVREALKALSAPPAPHALAALDRIEARVRDLQEDSNRLSECQAEVERLRKRERYLESVITQDGGVTHDYFRENERLRAAVTLLREVYQVPWKGPEAADWFERRLTFLRALEGTGE